MKNAAQHRAGEEVLGVAHLETRVQREDGTDINADVSEIVPIVHDDVRATWLKEVGPHENLGPVQSANHKCAVQIESRRHLPSGKTVRLKVELELTPGRIADVGVVVPIRIDWSQCLVQVHDVGRWLWREQVP